MYVRTPMAEAPAAHAGFLLGTRETLLETKDGGRTWTQRSIEAAKDEGALHRSFNLARPQVHADACILPRPVDRVSAVSDQTHAAGVHACIPSDGHGLTASAVSLIVYSVK